VSLILYWYDEVCIGLITIKYMICYRKLTYFCANKQTGVLQVIMMQVKYSLRWIVFFLNVSKKLPH